MEWVKKTDPSLKLKVKSRKHKLVKISNQRSSFSSSFTERLIPIKSFPPIASKMNWTKEEDEDEELLHVISMLYGNWELIAAELGYTTEECAIRYFTLKLEWLKQANRSTSAGFLEDVKLGVYSPSSSSSSCHQDTTTARVDVGELTRMAAPGM